MAKVYLNHFSPDRAATIYVEVLRLLQVEHLSRDAEISARRLAEIIGCDHRAISAAIALSTGENYHHLLARIRVKEAARCLRDAKYADWNVEEVGLLCGFASRQSFYNAFHKFHHTTPLKYRNAPHAS